MVSGDSKGQSVMWQNCTVSKILMKL